MVLLSLIHMHILDLFLCLASFIHSLNCSVRAEVIHMNQLQEMETFQAPVAMAFVLLDLKTFLVKTLWSCFNPEHFSSKNAETARSDVKM